MRAPLNPTLRHIGERLQREGEDTVQTPLPWAFLDRLCRLDEVEEAAARATGDKIVDHVRDEPDQSREER
jgi:hypothetical protein